LRQTEYLAKYSRTDGVGYKQHDWRKASLEENLSEGIDCSRSIWLAFRRAKLPYTKNSNLELDEWWRDRDYLSTASMTGDRSALSDYFTRCDGGELEIGDVLVYRRSREDPQRRTDGHVVMVIDPEKHIAWGSHNFDGSGGNTRPGAVGGADVGVEYQRIRSAGGFSRWDTSHMERVACWRYKRFAIERSTGIGARDKGALSDPCRAEGPGSPTASGTSYAASGLKAVVETAQPAYAE
jgi:hypothetical protein